MKKNMNGGFALLDVLIAVGILAIVFALVVVLSPSQQKPLTVVYQSPIQRAQIAQEPAVDTSTEEYAESENTVLGKPPKQDATRVADLNNLKQAINNFQTANPSVFIGDPETVYVSLPDTDINCANLNLPALPSSWKYHCVTEENLQNVNGTGWIPVNLSVLSQLPIDPRNNYADGRNAKYYYYTYAVSGGSGGDSWTRKANFGGDERIAGTGFSIGDKGYVGMGIYCHANMDCVYPRDFWQYDPAGDIWTQIADFGGADRYYATAFSIGSKGYVGLGIDENANVYKDFWEYDPADNTWASKTEFPGYQRHGAVGFSIGNKGYVGTGFAYNNLDINNSTKDFWEYDPITDVWTRKADFGGIARFYAIGFSMGTRGYIGIGIGEPSPYIDSGYLKDFWEYDPANDSWLQKADFSGAKRNDMVGFSIGTKGYVGTGSDLSGMRTEDFWEYDPTNDVWIKKADFGGGLRDYAVGFSIGDKGYIGTGLSGITYIGEKDFWEYSPGGRANFELNAKLYSKYYGFTHVDVVTSLTDVKWPPGKPKPCKPIKLAKLEKVLLQHPAKDNLPLVDGGDNGLLEVGTDLHIIPDSGGLCPTGMVWVPSPGRFCIDKYEASKESTAKQPDGRTCGGNCPVSVSGAIPWTNVVQKAKTPNNDAVEFCRNMGKDLPDQFEWFLASAGTPDTFNDLEPSFPARISGTEGPEPCMIYNYSGSGNRPQSSVLDGAFIKTGTAKSCISLVGAMDMIGNAAEWTKDQVNCNAKKCVLDSVNLPTGEGFINAISKEALPITVSSAPSLNFNYDYFFGTGLNSGKVGIIRGGANIGGQTGNFFMKLMSPTASNSVTGFRCTFK